MIGFEEPKPKNSLPVFNPAEFIIAEANAASASSLESLIVSNINIGNQIYNSNQNIINNYNPSYNGTTVVQATLNNNQTYNYLSFSTEVGKTYIVNINMISVDANYAVATNYMQQISLWLSDQNAANPETDTTLTNRVWANSFLYLTSTASTFSNQLPINANMFCIGTGNTKYVNVSGLTVSGTYFINETGGANYVYVYNN